MKSSDNHIPCMLKTKGRCSYNNLLSSNTCFSHSSHSSILLAIGTSEGLIYSKVCSNLSRNS